MASTSFISGKSGPSRKDTLADALAQGPPALADALAYAAQLAVLLRELHATHGAHGRVSPSSIVLKPSGLALLPSPSYFDEPERETDVRAWGALLYEMVTGQKPPVDAAAEPARKPFAMPKLGGTRSGPSAIRPAAQRLAMKCLLRAPHTLPTMQQVLSEVRLLALLARQYESRTGTAARPTVATPTVATPTVATPTNPKLPRPMATPPRRPAPLVAAPVSLDAAHPPVEPPPPDDPVTHEYRPTSFGKPSLKKPVEPAPQGSGPCPRCNGLAVFVSSPRSALETRLVRWGVSICRCHQCYHRWIAFARLRIAKSMPIGNGRRKKVKRRAKK